MKVAFVTFLLTVASASAFTVAPTQLSGATSTKTWSLHAKKDKKKKKKKGSSSSTSGLKGFGSTTKSSSTSTIDVPIDRSKEAMDLYSYLESNGAGSSLKRVALGFFPMTPDDTEFKLRGVVALKKIEKGDVIIEIPYEAAYNLGKESSDPTLPGITVLQEYCRWISGTKPSEVAKRDLGPYLSMLPPFRSDDVMGSTDFFSDEALDMFQSPQIKEETLARREKVLARFERDISPMMQIGRDNYKWKDGEDITEEHLRWAVWIVTSRVLTVQGSAESGDSFRLMIPLIDMCNHDRDSPHILSGRAVPGGTLKVIAGKTVTGEVKVYDSGIIFHNAP